MAPTSPLHAGWYATLDAHADRSCHLVYLFYVPEIGPFLLTDQGRVVELPSESLGWEWHGPYASPDAARAADLAHDCPCSVSADVWGC
jgi:hypothetical protein